MELYELMNGFAEKFGLEDLVQSENGSWMVDIDEMTVSFVEVPATRQVVTSAEVGEPPPEGRERLYKVLLESMYMGRATGGSTFSLDPETGRLQLFRFDPLPLLDLGAFLTMIEKFVNLLEEWRKIIADYRDSAPKLEKDSVLENAERRQMGLGIDGFIQV